MQSAVLASTSCPSVCRSVCPSVTRWYCIKTTQARITKSSTRIPQVLCCYILKVRPDIRRGLPQARALNESGTWKIGVFDHISVTVQDIGQRLLLITSRKSHTRFPFVTPKYSCRRLTSKVQYSGDQTKETKSSR